MKRPYAVFWGVLALAAISARAQSPLPDTISIRTPSPDVSARAAAFSGAWTGVWRGELPGALVVEQIYTNGTANVIYSWGDSPSGNFKAGWSRYVGRISGGNLQLESTNGAKISYTFEPDGTLLGRYQWARTRPSYATLDRVLSTNGAIIRATAEKPAVPWEEARIPVHSEVGRLKGKTFQLQTTIYRQTTAGKHPVAIINHGSTGPGIIPVSEVFRGDNAVEFFHSLGYVVVVPMRKGRGQSQGPNFEEDDSVSPAVELDSAMEDLHAVVEYITREKDIDPDRIVVTGVSRGGMLSVAYAGRYPGHVIGVVNFSGGWFGEGYPPYPDFNFEAFRNAGRGAKVPMLWLYADHDSYYSLPFIEREFSAFRAAGGRGELVEVRNLPENGHMLFGWVDRWQDKVTAYLFRDKTHRMD